MDKLTGTEYERFYEAYKENYRSDVTRLLRADYRKMVDSQQSPLNDILEKHKEASTEIFNKIKNYSLETKNIEETLKDGTTETSMKIFARDENKNTLWLDDLVKALNDIQHSVRPFDSKVFLDLMSRYDEYIDFEQNHDDLPSNVYQDYQLQKAQRVIVNLNKLIETLNNTRLGLDSNFEKFIEINFRAGFDALYNQGEMEVSQREFIESNSQTKDNEHEMPSASAQTPNYKVISAPNGYAVEVVYKDDAHIQTSIRRASELEQLAGKFTLKDKDRPGYLKAAVYHCETLEAAIIKARSINNEISFSSLSDAEQVMARYYEKSTSSPEQKRTPTKEMAEIER